MIEACHNRHIRRTGASLTASPAKEQPMTAGSISPFPLVRKGDQNHPVKTLQYLLRARGHRHR